MDVRTALKRMKSRKVAGPDDIPVEVRTCRERAVDLLTRLLYTNICLMNGVKVHWYPFPRTRLFHRTVATTVG